MKLMPLRPAAGVTFAALVTLTACAPAASSPGVVAGSIQGIVSAGPTCPVVTDPPNPDCADRPVAGAVIVVLDQAGQEVARVSSDAAGGFTVALPPGSYRLVPQPVDGLMGTAAEMEILVEAGRTEQAAIAYDTGIR